MRHALIPLAILGLIGLAACGPGPGPAPTDGESVKQRAIEAQTARRRTGADANRTLSEGNPRPSRQQEINGRRALPRIPNLPEFATASPAVFICGWSPLG